MSALKNLTQTALSYSLRILPTPLLQQWGQNPSNSTLRRLVRLALKNRTVIINQGIATGLKFNCGLSNPDYSLGINERPIQKIVADFLQPGTVFYDIGAHVGFFSVIAAKLVGSQGKVYAFEPDPQNAACLQFNVEVNQFSNVKVFEKAVSKTTGTGELLLAEYPGGHTLASAGTPPDLKGAMTVELVCIDELVNQQVLEPPSVIKIDVEGAELEVLEGMTQTLQQYHPTILYEIDDATAELLNNKRHPIQKFLEKFNYKIDVLPESYPGIGWQVEHAIATPKPS